MPHEANFEDCQYHFVMLCPNNNNITETLK
jgi:hypothetical protein